MFSVEVSVLIDRDLPEVFRFVQDEGNMPKWDADLFKATKTSPGKIGKGTTFHLDIKPFMGAKEGSGEVVAYEPNRRIELQFQMGRFSPHVYHLFEADNGGTRFTRRVVMEAPGIMRLMEPMMRANIRKRNVGYLEALKQLLEA